MRSNRHGPRAARATLALPLLTGTLMSACATNPPEPVDEGAATRAFAAATPYNPEGRSITRVLSSRAQRPPASAGPELIDTRTFSAAPEMPATEPALLAGDPGPLRRVKLAFNNAPAADVIRTIVGEHLNRNYLIDSDLGGVATLDLDEEMTPGDLLDLLNTMAAIYGWAIDDRPGMMVFRELDTASLRSPDTPIMLARSAAGTAEVGVRVRRMKHINATELTGGGNNSLLSKVLSEGAVLATSGRLLVMVDTAAQLNKASALLAAIDVPAFDGVRIETYRLTHSTPENAATILDTLAQGASLSSPGQGETPLRFLAISGTDRLAVVARDPSVLGYARTLIEQIDRPDHAERRYRFLYNIQHADATGLQALINETFAPRIEGDRSATDTDKMQLAWDTTEGRLIVNARYDDYAELIETLRVLDAPPQQVLLQNVIAEISLTDDLEFGVEYFLEGFDIEGLGNLEFAANPGTIAGGSGSAFFVGASGLALVQALDAESSANILSQPRLTVTDNTEASFQVGGEVPIEVANQDTDTVAGGDTTIRREIEYRDVGVILTVQPRINDTGDVRLAINLEIRSVGPDSPLGPTFDERILVTDVVVPHGRTLVLAGFIDDQSDRRSTRTPVLGSIPGVGAAFTTIDNSDTRRELILTITPEVINNPNRVNETVSGFLAATERMSLILSSRAGELPTGMLRDPSLDPVEPAVRLVLPERPVGIDTPPSEQFIDLTEPTPAGAPDPTESKAPEQRPAGDDPDDPLRGLPEDTPEFIKQFLRQGAGDPPRSSLDAGSPFASLFTKPRAMDAWRWRKPFVIAAAGDRGPMPAKRFAD